jgi:DNA-binding transcriptional MocR family regulator
MIDLDRQSPRPLALQIELGLGELMSSGRLPQGSRLMSVRRLAQQLAVSVQTVVLAYDRLVAAGRIESRGKTGFFVSDARASVPDPETLLEAGEEQDGIWLAQQAHEQRAGMLLAGSGALPAAWLQEAVPAAVLTRALARSSAGLASRCPPQGLPELRERIALMLRGQGLAVEPAQLMSCWGGTQAIDLICRSFLQPGDAVLVEDPGYFLMLGRLRQQGLRLLPITRRPDGLDLEELEAACRQHRPRLLFMQSVLHNPTGWGASPANLHRVLMLARQHGVLIAEDDVQGHFHPGLGGAPTRLAALAGLEGVIYYSSFCKALSPALRIGYLGAEPALLRPLLREKILAVMSTAALNEYVALEVLAAGRWRKHLERLQQRLLAARQATRRQLEQAGLSFETEGGAGLFLWPRLPDGVATEPLVQDAVRNQILLVRGATFSARQPGQGGASDRHLRINAVFGQHPRLASYLGERLQALARAGAALQRLGQ